MLSSIKKYYRMFSLFIFGVIFFGSLSITYKDVKAAEPWVEIVGSSNGIQDARVDISTIIQTGIHNDADDNIVRYRTQFYYMTTKTYDFSQMFSDGANETIKKESVPFKFGDEDDLGSTLKVEYIIKMNDFMKAAAELDITGDDIVQNGSATVYMNNVFDSYIGTNTRHDNVYGYQEMLAAEGWSSETREYLKGYYNYKYVISNASVFNVKMIAVDDNGTTLNADLLGHPKKAIYNEVIPINKNAAYNLPTILFSIKKNGITYKYDHWEYEYKDRSTEKNKTVGSFTGSTVTFNAPDVCPGTTLSIKMVYKPDIVKYNYKIVMVDKNHNYIKDIVTGPNATESGKTVSYSSIIDRTVNSKVYKYQNLWDFNYTDVNGNAVEKLNQPGAIYVKSMPAAKENSLAVFSMVYDPGTAPTVIPTPTPKPDVFVPPNITPPPSDSAHMEFTTPVNTGVINADNRGAEKFTSIQGVPTTESLYGQVMAKDYLVGYSLVKKVGVKYYPITVKKNYNLSWMTATPISAGGPKPVSETVTITQTITVARAYAYWEIMNFECYKIGSAVLRNYALPNEFITLNPNYAYYNPPSVSVRHSGDESYHIIPPSEYTNGITLPSENISSTGISKPNVKNEDFSSQAWSMTGNISVKSDYLNFNGTTVMNDSIAQMIVPDIDRNGVTQCETFINQNVLYKPNNVIEATKVNGTYASSGTITYNAIATVNATRPVNPQYSIDGVNKMVIHTPVVCKPSITADNAKHSQLINPTQDCTQLVLDPDPTLSDFVVSISNTGPHSNKQGYYSRDFSRSLRDPNISYIAEDDGVLMNQVKFPFDVYMDKGVAYDQTDDKFIKSHTWLTIGRTTPRFYLPMTVNEGVYSVQFRTVAVNGLPYITQTEEYANKKLTNYVATDTLNVEISGRIYGLTIYDLTDYPIWEEVFRVNDSMDFKKDFTKYTVGTGLSSYSKNRSYTYTLGTNNQYGADTGRSTKYTFPLVNGSHPFYKNMGILKTGYLIRFLLNTTGNMFSDSCKVSIKPKFYHVDKDGNNRVAVDLYYTESINNKTKHLVKVGSPLDQTNLKTVRTGDLYLGIPEAELRQTATLRGMTFSKFTAKSAPMFNFSEIRLNWAFRTYINNAYTNAAKGYDSFEDMGDTGIKESDILERMQRWYGQYYIPNEVHAVEKDFDVMDYADKYGVDYNQSFWLKDGYIIVNISIETIGEDGSRRLSYINAANYRDNGNCSMWIQEGPVQTKKSSDGITFNFFAGDLAIFYNGKSASQDYNSGAIY